METMAPAMLDYEKELESYVGQETAASSLIASLGKLFFGRSIELVLFRNSLVDQNVPEVLRLHDYANEVVGKEISVIDSAELAKEIVAMEDVVPSKLDIGRLASEWKVEGAAFESKRAFLENKLGPFMDASDNGITPRDVVLYGFGRIGRLAARELIKQAGKGEQLRLRAIVVRKISDAELTKRAALLRNDSVHGPFPGVIKEDYENKALIINGQVVKFIAVNNPEDADYTAHGFKDVLVIDNTGVFTDREALGRHKQGKGVEKVLLTAPGKEIPNIVYGVNNEDIDADNEDIFSAASCTTNAISPILKVIEDNYGVVKGHLETVHAYTNDQNLLDNFHKKPRRGRSAAINMVITSTGAGKAVTKVIPSFANKLTANAVRVPTPNGSLAILSLELNKETSVEDINNMVRKYALKGELVNQINFAVDPELVSNDIVGNTCCSVFDSNATIVSTDKKNAVLYVWYDNEFGYTKQVIRLAKSIAKVRREIYY